MTSHLSYVMAQQRSTELAYRAEQARLVGEARPAVSAPPPRWNLGRRLATHLLRAAHLSAAAHQAKPGPKECLRCDT
jgi:hypothetical protein